MILLFGNCKRYLEAGGRYWMWHTHTGGILFDFLGEPGEETEPARFSAKRYGVFLQVAYRPNHPTFELEGDCHQLTLVDSDRNMIEALRVYLIFDFSIK